MSGKERAVRHAGAADWQVVRALRLASLQERPDAFVVGFEEEAGVSRDVWERRLRDSNAAALLALDQGSVVGLTFVRAMEERRGSLGLSGMWVAPAARGKGFGSMLLEAALEWARRARFDQVVLEVSDANAEAIELYRRHGFSKTGRLLALPPPRAHVTGFEMGLDLKQAFIEGL